MDPIGFGLEHFDAIGAWRDRDGTAAIDATGVLPDMTAFDGAVQLASALKHEAPSVTACVTQKMFAYSLGRDDNSAVFFSSEITDGNLHNHSNLPIVLAGRGGGMLNPGRAIPFQNGAVANLFVSMLRTSASTSPSSAPTVPARSGNPLEGAGRQLDDAAMMPCGPTRVRLMAQSSTYRTAALGLRLTATLTTSQATHDVGAIGPVTSRIPWPSSQKVSRP